MVPCLWWCAEYENLISGLRGEIKDLKGQLAVHSTVPDTDPLSATLKKFQAVRVVNVKANMLASCWLRMWCVWCVVCGVWCVVCGV
jgi:hypothetical protein